MSTTTNPPDREQPPIIMGSLTGGSMLMEYRIEHVLGKPGGFGITYLAVDTNLEKKVAIKEYLPTDFALRTEGSSISIRSVDDREAFEWGMKSFLNEARTLARYKHPNVVQVHRLFEANHTAYIVMEYVEGDTLSETLRKKSPLSEIDLKQILLPIADGLDTVHKSGVLHRDIKPHNIILRRDGTPVLIDFGAARNSLGSKTRSIISILTAGYAPIEQYSEVGDQGPWTDIYALAAVAYSAISGKTPPDAINRLSNDPMKPAVVIGEGRFSKPFLEALDWALRMKREDRPQNLGDWRAALSGLQPVPGVDKKAGGMVIDAVDFDLTAAPKPAAAVPPPAVKPAAPPSAAPVAPAMDMMQTIVKPLSSLMETQDIPASQLPKAAPPAAAPTPPPETDFERTTFTPRRAFPPPPAAPVPATPATDDASMKTVLGMSLTRDPLVASSAAKAIDPDATIFRSSPSVAKPAPASAQTKPPSKPSVAKPEAAAAHTDGKKWLPLAVGGVALLLVAVLSYLIWGGKSAPQKPTTEPMPEVAAAPSSAAATSAPATTNANEPANTASTPSGATAQPSSAAGSPDVGSSTATTASAATSSNPAATPSTTSVESPAPTPAPSNPSTSISTIPENGESTTKPMVADAAPAKPIPAPAKPVTAKPVPDPKATKAAADASAHNDLAAKMLPQLQGNWSARVKQPSVALDGGCSVAAYRTWKLEITGLSSDQSRITGHYTVDVNGKANSGCAAPELNVGTAGSFLGKPLSANQIQLSLANGPCTGDCAAGGKLLTRGNGASTAQLVMIGEKVISISIIDNGLNYVFTNH